jgi:phospholipid/cholesterol/gamma-HCH transport system permease protein
MKKCAYTLEVADQPDDSRVIRISGRLSVDTAADVLRDILSSPFPTTLRINLSGIVYFDSAGAAVLAEITRAAKQHACRVTLEDVSDRIQGLLRVIDLDSFATAATVCAPRIPGLFVRIGDWSYRFAADCREILVFLGAMSIACLQSLIRPWSIRWRDVLFYLERAGVDAVPILLLIQFLLGITLAFLGASQLEQFGANIYVADMVSLAMVYEIGPLMTAILVAGRSGAAFAAEIGTMKVSEEVDALTAMGFDTQRFLVIPKLIAVAISMPCLLILSDLVGIIGGGVVASSILDVQMVSYINQAYKALSLTPIIQGLVKSVFFAILIAGVSCMRGFQVRGGAESVGRYTTSAVVSSIFLIIIANAIFTILFQYL